MALPKPVWSKDDIDVAREVVRNPSSLIWSTWSKNPAKLAVLQAMVSCQVRIGRVGYFGWHMANALAQESVCFLHFLFIGGGGSITKLFQFFNPPENIFISLSRYPHFR